MGRILSNVALLFVVAAVCVAGTAGVFRGFLMEGADTKPGWMYVQSRNDMLRLVNLSGAKISYADGIPSSQRRDNPRDSLLSGAEVRVEAEQDKQGDWRARRVEILRLAPARRAGR